MVKYNNVEWVSYSGLEDHHLMRMLKVPEKWIWRGSFFGISGGMESGKPLSTV